MVQICPPIAGLQSSHFLLNISISLLGGLKVIRHFLESFFLGTVSHSPVQLVTLTEELFKLNISQMNWRTLQILSFGFYHVGLLMASLQLSNDEVTLLGVKMLVQWDMHLTSL